MNFDSILIKFGQDIGLGPVSLDDRDSCYLRFDQNTLVIEQVPDQNALYIYTVFHDLPTINRELYLEQLLICNHFGQGSGRAWFSYNAETQEVLLMTRIVMDTITYDEFVLTLEQFLFSIEHSKSFLENLQQEKVSPLYQNLHIKNPFA